MTQEPGGSTLEERRLAAEIRLREAELRIKHEELQLQKRRSPLWGPVLALAGVLLAAGMPLWFKPGAEKGGEATEAVSGEADAGAVPSPPTTSGSVPIRSSVPGVVEVTGTDTIEFICQDPANPWAAARVGLDRNELPAGRGTISARDLASGVHSLWWSVNTPSATRTCEVVVNGTVRYRDQVASSNGSVLLRVR